MPEDFLGRTLAAGTGLSFFVTARWASVAACSDSVGFMALSLHTGRSADTIAGVKLSVRGSFLRRLHNLPNLFDQLSGSIRRRKYVKLFNVRTVLQAIIDQKASYDQDSHFGVPRTQVLGGFMPGYVRNIRMRNQQLDLRGCERVEGHA